MKSAGNCNGEVVMDNKRSSLAVFLMGVLLLLPVVAWTKQDESTPTTLLRAIEQRSKELDQKSKNLSLKEQRMRILEAEVTEKLNQIKKTREEIKRKEAAEKKIAEDAKKEALAKGKASEESASKAKAAQAKADARLKAKTTQDKADAQANAELAQAKAEAAQAKADLAQAKADAAEARAEAAQAGGEVSAKEKAAQARADARTRSNAQREKGKARPASKGVKAAEAAVVADEEIDKAALEEQEKLAAINKLEASRKAIEDKRFKELAKIYDKMPPQEAGLRLQNMHEIIALEIIPRMNKKKSAKALASMDPVVAVRYTERLGMGGPFFPPLGESSTPKESSPPKQ